MGLFEVNLPPNDPIFTVKYKVDDEGLRRTLKEIQQQAKLELLDELEKPCPHTYTSPGHTAEFRLKKYCPYCMAEIRKELEGK